MYIDFSLQLTLYISNCDNQWWYTRTGSHDLKKFNHLIDLSHHTWFALSTVALISDGIKTCADGSTVDTSRFSDYANEKFYWYSNKFVQTYDTANSNRGGCKSKGSNTNLATFKTKGEWQTIASFMKDNEPRKSRILLQIFKSLYYKNTSFSHIFANINTIHCLSVRLWKL